MTLKIYTQLDNEKNDKDYFDKINNLFNQTKNQSNVSQMLVKLENMMFLQKSKTRSNAVFKRVSFGDPSEIRTPDTLIKSQVLCQLS